MTRPTYTVTPDQPVYSESEVLEIVAATVAQMNQQLAARDQAVAESAMKAMLDVVDLPARDQAVADAVAAAMQSEFKFAITSMPDRVVTRRITQRSKDGLLEEVVSLEQDA